MNRGWLIFNAHKWLSLKCPFTPGAGAMIKGSGGLRKIRWNLPGVGKRGALRVIYYFDQPETIYMLFMYKKNKQEDLTPEQVKILKKAIKENLL
jgi:hypothetical protein